MTMGAEIGQVAHEAVIDTPEIRPNSRLAQAGRWAGKIALFAATSLGIGVASAMISPSEVYIGPHRAEVRLTLDGEAELDLGLIGSLSKPISNGIFGAEVSVKEIPVRRNLAQNNFGSNEIEEYARFFANYESDIADVRSALTDRVKEGAILGGAGLLLASLLAGEELKRLAGKRGQELSQRKTMRMAAASVTAMLLLGSTANSQAESVSLSSVFAGSSLEGVKIEGMIMPDLVNKYGAQLMEYLKTSREFYDKVEINLKDAIDSADTLTPGHDKETLLYYTDLHCNIGMSEIIGKTSRLYHADMLISGGDDTMSGTDIEEQCIRAVARNTKDMQRLVSPGNHDSAQTEQQFARHGFKVLNGSITEFGGYTFLGDDDPRESIFGQSIHQKRAETVREMGDRLSAVACAQEVDFLIVHDPVAGQKTAENGCAKLILSGHTHTERFITEGSVAPHLTGESAGGAEDERPTIGPIASTAKLYIIQVDKVNHAPLGYQAINILPTGRVVIENPHYFDKQTITTDILGPGPH